MSVTQTREETECWKKASNVLWRGERDCERSIMPVSLCFQLENCRGFSERQLSQVRTEEEHKYEWASRRHLAGHVAGP